MTNALAVASEHSPAALESQHPFQSRAVAPAGVNYGAVSVEQERAIAEVQGQIIIAKRFPRDIPAAYAELMESAKFMAMAEVAFYKVPRGGGSVTGPSIRAAEEMARAVGNIEYGHRELSRSDDKSEVEVYAWDKQTNLRRIRQLTVPHVIDTKNGPKAMRDQKEIDDLIANKASKQVRALLLSIVPLALKEAFLAECKKTLAGGNDGKATIQQRVLAMVNAFAPFGVTTVMLEENLGHKLAEVTVDDLVELSGIYNALKDGGKVAEYFGAEAKEEADESDAAAAIKAAGKGGATTKRTAPQKPIESTAEEKPKEPEKAAEPAKEPPQEPVKDAEPPKEPEPAVAAQEQAQEPVVADAEPEVIQPVEQAQEPAAQPVVAAKSESMF